MQQPLNYLANNDKPNCFNNSSRKERVIKLINDLLKNMVKKTLPERIHGQIHKLSYYLHHPKYAITYAKRFSKDFSQEDLEYCVSHRYEYRTGKKLNFDNVNTFNEKLNWLKCYYHDDRMTECADKVSAPAYFKEQTGLDDNYIVKNLGVYDTPDEIDFEALPDKFVLKSNWGSGKQVIVTNKNQVDFTKIKKRIRSWNNIKANHYYEGFEYGYKNIIPKIVCEEFIDFEYKIEFFCFDGDPCYFWTVYNDKTDEVWANFYDAVSLTKLNLKQGYPNSSDTIVIPNEYDEMFSIASNLSKGFPFVRIDFFKANDGFKFSEMTFYHWSGLMPFEPASFDFEFGEKIKLPTKLI